MTPDGLEWLRGARSGNVTYKVLPLVIIARRISQLSASGRGPGPFLGTKGYSNPRHFLHMFGGCSGFGGFTLLAEERVFVGCHHAGRRAGRLASKLIPPPESITSQYGTP